MRMARAIVVLVSWCGFYVAAQAGDTTGRQLLYFHSPQCAVCTSSVDPELDAMRAAGWNIGPGLNRQIREVDVTQEPEMAAVYKITVLPTFVELKDGHPSHYHYGAADRWMIGKFRKGSDEVPDVAPAQVVQPQIPQVQPVQPNVMPPQQPQWDQQGGMYNELRSMRRQRHPWQRSQQRYRQEWSD